MLVLSRRVGERIVIGDNIVLELVGIERGKILLGIQAPRSVPILRGELMPRPSSQDDLGQEETPTHA